MTAARTLPRSLYGARPSARPSALPLAGAVLASAAALLLPLTWTGLAGFPAYMLRHMALVAVIAPLLVLGWPGLARAFAVPPMLAAGVEFVTVWGWHLPGLHLLSQTTPWGFALEQAMFLGAGLAVWAGALAAPPLLGAGAMLLTSMHMTLLGALLVLAPAQLYSGSMPGGLAGQQVGGMLMLGIGTPVYLLAGLLLVRRALTSPDLASNFTPEDPA